MLVLKINTIHFYWWNLYVFSFANDFIYILSIYSNCCSLSEFFRSICPAGASLQLVPQYVNSTPK